MNGLAYTGRITTIDPIEGADFLELATVICGEGGKWHGVVKKGDFLINSLCRVYLPDALLPSDQSEFKFMERYGWRVKQQKLRGVPSEVLIMPNKKLNPEVGEDITIEECVKKFEKPLSPQLSGMAKGNFPSFIPKTDEPHFQGAWRLVEALKGHPFYVTEKVDGSSGTAYVNDGVFSVCSRNLDLKETEGNVFWKVARDWVLEFALRSQDKNIAIQFEVAGPGIQSNPLKLEKPELFLFNIYYIDEKRYGDFEELKSFAEQADPVLQVARVLLQGTSFPEDITSEQLQALAEGTYPCGTQREGIVIRPQKEMKVRGQRLSFKVINLKYKE